ncbi:MAG: spermidine/putrescine ABC transporter substrate-binding protein [Actinobacteria bacterium]|nr:spermidine/putrescine ABC transporter substrate-binding protein [Actinomycetota bacterium]
MTEINRRQLLLRGAFGAGGLASLPAILAACGGSGGIEGQSAESDAAPASVDQTLAEKFVLSNWPLYIDIDEETKKSPTLEGFTAETGVPVEYIEDINSNEEFFGIVQGPLSQGQFVRDMAIPTGYAVVKLKDLGYLEQFDTASIPNLANISIPAPPWNEGFAYGVPWQSYMTGIAYNSSKIAEAPTVEELLTDPALKGKVTLLNSMNDTMGVLLQAQGYSSETINPDEFDATIEVLQKAVDDGQIRQFTGNDYTGPLSKGDLFACLAWSGDVIQLQADDPGLMFSIPETGGGIATDYMCILKGGSVYTSSVFANYVLDPARAAQLSLGINYISPVAASKAEAEKVDPDVASNQLIYPDQATLDKLQEFDPAVVNDPAYNEKFQAVIGA